MSLGSILSTAKRERDRETEMETEAERGRERKGGRKEARKERKKKREKEENKAPDINLGATARCGSRPGYHGAQRGVRSL